MAASKSGCYLQYGQLNRDFGGGRIGAVQGAVVWIRPPLDILQVCDVTVVHVLKIDIEGYEGRVLLPFFREASVVLFPDHITMEDTEHGRWTRNVFLVLPRCGF